MAVLVPTLRDGGGAPALAVTHSGDWLELRIQDAGASGAEIEEASKRSGVPDFSAPPVEETVRLNTIEYGREVLRLPISQVRESSGHFILWAGRAAQPGEDVAASPATFAQWFGAMLTRERHPTP